MTRIHVFCLTAVLLSSLSCSKKTEEGPAEVSSSSPVAAATATPNPLPSLDLPPPVQLDKLKVGSTRQEMIDLLGTPTGQMNVGGVETVYYHGVGLKIKHGKVIHIPEDLKTELEKGRQKEIARLKKQRERKVEQLKAKQAAAKPKPVTGNQVIRNGGQSIDLAQFTGNGKVTVVDFFADWCGPCRSMKPHLERLAQDPDIVLIQIDIVNWDTPINRQHGIRTIPDVRVFDPQGNQVGKKTHDFRKITANVEKARKKL